MLFAMFFFFVSFCVTSLSLVRASEIKSSLRVRSEGDVSLFWASVDSTVEPQTLDQACRTRNIHAVEDFILRGANVNEKNSIGETPLYVAVSVGDFPIVSLLIEKGANVAAKTPHGWTPLHVWAQLSEDFAILDALIKEDTSLISMKDKQGNTPFLIACLHHKVKAALLLLEKGASFNDENNNGEIWIHLGALANKDPKTFINEILERFVSQKDKFEKNILKLKNDLLNRKTNEGQTVLHLVCQYCSCHQQETLDFLLKNEALLTTVDYGGKTAFHYACMAGNGVIVQYLLNKESDLLNGKSKEGLTPLDYALFNGKLEVALALIQKGAVCGVQKNSENCINILHLLVQKPRLTPLLEKVLEYYKETGLIPSKIDEKNIDDENTPLDCAKLSGNKKAYNLLKLYGANGKIKNKQGKRPKELA